MIQVRRPSSADGRRWLAHTPKDTMYTNTVLQVSGLSQVELEADKNFKEFCYATTRTYKEIIIPYYQVQSEALTNQGKIRGA